MTTIQNHSDSTDPNTLRIPTVFTVGGSFPLLVFPVLSGPPKELGRCNRDEVRQAIAQLDGFVSDTHKRLMDAYQEHLDMLQGRVEVAHYLDHWDDFPEVRSGHGMTIKTRP